MFHAWEGRKACMCRFSWLLAVLICEFRQGILADGFTKVSIAPKKFARIPQPNMIRAPF